MFISRNALLMMALFALGYLGFSGYLYLMRPERAVEANSPSMNMAMLAVAQRSSASAESVASMSSSEADPSQSISPETIEKWLADAIGDDAKARAAAIVALATAPRAQAIPTLQKVLNRGDPQVDRPLALNSLRTLALQQGDADDSIRGVLRQAIYHGEDEAATRAAQAVLDDVENKLGQPAPTADR